MIGALPLVFPLWRIGASTPSLNSSVREISIWQPGRSGPRMRTPSMRPRGPTRFTFCSDAYCPGCESGLYSVSSLPSPKSASIALRSRCTCRALIAIGIGLGCFTFLPPSATLAVCRAIWSSSFVAMTSAFTRDPPVLISATGDSWRDLRVGVVVLVEANAHELEALQDAASHLHAVLSDAASEHDGVDAAHRGGVGADVLAALVGEHGDRQAGAVVAFFGLRLDVAQVVAEAAEPLEAAVAVEQRVGLVDAELARELEHHTGVDVAAAGSHHEALERCEAHRGLHRAAELDRACARPVAEV